MSRLTPRQDELLAKGRFAELLAFALDETSDIALATEAAEIAFQEEASFGFVGDEWHGPEAPGPGWVQTGTGPHGGKVWKRQAQAKQPAQQDDERIYQEIQPDLDEYNKSVSHLDLDAPASSHFFPKMFARLGEIVRYAGGKEGNALEQARGLGAVAQQAGALANQLSLMPRHNLKQDFNEDDLVNEAFFLRSTAAQAWRLARRMAKALKGNFSLENEDPEAPKPVETIAFEEETNFDGAAFAAEDWVHYAGARGGKGWQNRRTGEVVYQDERPESGGAAAPKKAPQRQAPKQEPPKQQPKQQPESQRQQQAPKQEPPKQSPQPKVDQDFRQTVSALEGHLARGSYRGAIGAWAKLTNEQKDSVYKTLERWEKNILLEGERWQNTKTVVEQRLKSYLTGAQTGKNVDPAKKKEYFANSMKVIDQWNRPTMERFLAGIGRGIQWHGNNLELNIAYADKYPNDPRSARYRSGVATMVGYYTAHRDGSGSLTLDGPWKAGEAGTFDYEVYAHEFTHALDGPKFEISNSPEWKAAWQEEINQRGVSEYAWKEPEEGFAEFGRLLYSGTDPAKLWQIYPKCMTVFYKRGFHEYAPPRT